MSDEEHIKNEEKPSEPTLLEIAKADAAECKSLWQRALADYQNLKKETEARRAEWVQMSRQQILEEFIPVYEHLKLSMGNDQVASKSDPWVEGVKYVLKQFADILKSHGVEEIKTLGGMFDPAFHESAGEEPAAAEAMAGKDGGEAGRIIREVSGGYKMGGRVIKPARVIISK